MKTAGLFSLVVLSFIVNFAFGAAGTLPGGGIQTDPYLIEDIDDFDRFAADPNYWASDVYTELTVDINLAGRTYDTAVIAADLSSGSGFDGIEYEGNFNGTGHVIRDLTINGDNYCGLFGKTYRSNISNLGVENVSVTGTGYYAGGLVAYKFYCYFYNVYSTGTVTGHTYVGGLLGYNHGTIRDSYSTASVSGNNCVGGFTSASFYGTITNCYSTGLVSGNSEVGGLLAKDYDTSKVYDSYWNKETSNQNTSSGGIPKTTAEMKDASTYIGWDEGSWTIDQGNGYPRLTWENATGTLITTDYPGQTYSGSGTSADPFVLSTSADITCMSRRSPDWGSNFIMANNINMTGITYIPISWFYGTFDGNGHIIESLSIDGSIIGQVDFLGFFAKSKGTVSNLGLENVNVSGKESIGGLMGANHYGTISDCYSNGEIVGSGNFVGGLVGENRDSDITRSYSHSSVTGDIFVGGLVGITYYSNLTNSYSTGLVTGHGEFGGLTGQEFGGTLTNSFWDVETSGIGTAGSDNYGATGKTTAQMQTESTFTAAGWDFEGETTNGSDNFWKMDDYPILSWQPDPGTMVSVPGIVDMTQANAETAITAAGLVVGAVTSDYSNTVTAGLVISQYPTAGSLAASGSSVDFVVSLGVDPGTGPVPQSIPYVQTFDSVLPTDADGWEYYNDIPSVDGILIDSGELVLTSPETDPTCSSFSLNEAILHVDLAGQSNVFLSFDTSSGSMFSSTLLPSSFTGHVNGDGVCVSHDGVTWYQVVSVTELDAGSSFSVNLDSVGITYTNDCMIKFQQYDYDCAGLGVVWPVLGRAFDNIQVVIGTPPAGDIYESDNDSTYAKTIATDGVPQVRSIDPVGDEDWVSFTIDDTYEVTMETTGTSGDTVMYLYDSALNYLDYDDDGGSGVFSLITRTLTAGTYYIRIHDFGNDSLISEYLLSISKKIPATYSGGSGTSVDPYQIANKTDLLSLATHPGDYSKAFIMTADIDLAGEIFSMAVIAPDTDDSDYVFTGILFQGGFDGNGHVIRNLTVDGASYGGLFGYIGSGGSVTNLGLENASVTGTNNYTGGIAAYQSYASISNCYVTGTVNGSSYTGGLVGTNSSGEISNCYSNAAVDGTNYVGGLMGHNAGEVSSCYATGPIGGYDYVGGLVGSNIRGSVIDCYWDKETSGQAASAGGCSKTTVQMQQAATFIGWNDGSWTINEGADYPRLSWQNAIGTVITTGYPARTYGGGGISSDPFVLTDANDIVCMSVRVPDWNSNFILVDDVDMSGIVGYVPPADFGGDFDGNNYAIRNLTVDSGIIGNSTQIGFFGTLTGDVSNLKIADANMLGDIYIGGVAGFLNNGSVDNSHVTGGIVKSQNDYVGGLIGCNYQGQMSNCSSTAEVRGFDDYTGGLVGFHNYGIIANCFADCTASGEDYVGGLVGRNYSGNIVYSYAVARVTGTGDYSGGLVGYNYTGSISNCYAIGQVSGVDYGTGGLVGYNSSSSIDSSYAACTVSGNVNYAGGLVGYQSGYGASMTNSFWDTDISGITAGYHLDSTSPGTVTNVVDLTTLQMQTLTNFTNAGWDFIGETPNGIDDRWYMPLNEYPKLIWQATMKFDGAVEPVIGQELAGLVPLQVYSVFDEALNWSISGHESCAWITSVAPDSGSSTGPMDKATIEIGIDAIGLVAGEYTHELLLSAGNGDSMWIPVSLHVYKPVGMEEYGLLAQYWMMTDCNETQPCSDVDFYVDGTIDLLDLDQLAMSWLGEGIIMGSDWTDFLEDFSAGQPVEAWSYNSTGNGRITIVDQRLRMDCSVDGTNSLNEAILHIDLENQSGITLSFWQAESGDEQSALPDTFTGSYNGDGVAVSPDGVNWTTVVNASALDVGTVGQTFTVDLDALGVEYTSDFQIKFQQYDNYTWSSDGREWDDIQIVKSE